MRVRFATLVLALSMSQTLFGNLPFRKIEWPADDKAHVNDSKVVTEWWYYAGKVASREGREARNFAYYVTLRLAKDVSGNTPTLDFQLNDLDNNKVYGDSITLNDAALGTNNLNITSKEFSLQKNEGKYALQAKIPVNELVVGLDLVLTPLKKPLFLGQNAAQRGLVDMGNGTNSFYYSITRLQTEGYVHIGKEKFTINADPSLSRSWMDHQWGDFSLLQTLQTNPWVWMGIQLSDGTDIAVGEFVSVRNRRPIGEAFAQISLPDGESDYKKANIDPGAVRLGGYPQSYTIKIGETSYELNSIPQSQLSQNYWMGLMSVDGQNIFEPNAPFAFVENTVPPESTN